MLKVMLIIGTRPEAIKMASVARALRQRFDEFHTTVVYTGQHRELLDQMTGVLDLRPDADLRVMSDNQSLSTLTARLLLGIDQILDANQPQVVLAQGDTATVVAAGLACFYRKIPFEHVEAGLRTGDLRRPFPEEGNRRISGVLATHHFAPTEQARANLLAEGVPEQCIEVTGNTVIDTLQRIIEAPVALPFTCPDGPWILVTLHRREGFGTPFVKVLRALRAVLAIRPDVMAIYPAHPNPNARAIVEYELSDCPNVQLIEPLCYDQFVTAMSAATVILSDSGGVQEEAPSVQTPLLIAREMTERPEGVDAGLAELVGYDTDLIQRRLLETIDMPRTTPARVQGAQSNPYGDGYAANRIVDSLRRRYRTNEGPS